MSPIFENSINEELRRAEKMLEQLPSWKATERLRAKLRIEQLLGIIRNIEKQ